MRPSTSETTRSYGSGNPDEPILDVEPDLRVVDVCDHEHPGVRRRALKAFGCRRSLASSGCASNGLAAVTSPPGGGTSGGKKSGRAEGGGGGATARTARAAAGSGGGPGELPPTRPQRRGDPPRRRGQEPFHLAPVLVSGRFQMGDPDEERFVLLAQRVEKIVPLFPHYGTLASHPRL